MKYKFLASEKQETFEMEEGKTRYLLSDPSEGEPWGELVYSRSQDELMMKASRGRHLHLIIDGEMRFGAVVF